VRVFDSLIWGVKVGVAVQHLPQIIQRLAQVAIHFSTLTSSFCPQHSGGKKKRWKSERLEWRSLEVFPAHFSPALFAICL